MGRPCAARRVSRVAAPPVTEVAAELVARGRRQGYLTYDDLLEVLPEVEEDLEALEHLYTLLEAAGVELRTDTAPVDPAAMLVRPVLATAQTDDDGFDSDDTISLYLREVSKIALLTAAEEVDFSQRMENGLQAEADLARFAAELTPGERELLLFKVADGQSARKHLVQANSRLVIALAKRYMNQGVPFLDLIQEGNLGLMRAADKFDWRRGLKFSTYATWWVRQAITRALADQGRTIRLPVHMSDRIRRLYRASRDLEQKLGREPTLAELAAELDISTRKVEQVIEITQRPLSLERPVGEEQDSELGEFVASDAADPDEDAFTTMLREDLEDVLTSLTQREARVLALRYGLADGHAYTLKEVGEKFGLTRERIRQIENEALARLREPRRSRRLMDYLV